MTVQEVFDRLILPKLAAAPPQPVALSVVEAVNLTVEYISAKLVDRKSDLVKSILNTTIPAGAQSTELPGNYAGLKNHPVAGGRELEVLDPVERSIFSGTTGPPSKYEIAGSKIFIYPSPSSDLVVMADYWTRPDPIESMADDIPWNGLFDQLVSDAALKFSVGGHALAVTAAFAAEIENGLNQVLFSRTPPLPTRRRVNTF